MVPWSLYPPANRNSMAHPSLVWMNIGICIVPTYKCHPFWTFSHHETAWARVDSISAYWCKFVRTSLALFKSFSYFFACGFHFFLYFIKFTMGVSTSNYHWQRWIIVGEITFHKAWQDKPRLTAKCIFHVSSFQLSLQLQNLNFKYRKCSTR